MQERYFSQDNPWHIPPNKIKKMIKKMKKSYKKADKISQKSKSVEACEKKEADNFLENSIKNLDN